MRRFCWLSVLICIVGCSSNERNWKETIPVTGVVLVDGKPAEGVSVSFNPTAGMDVAQPTVTKAMTDKEGHFAATTYELGDGAPVGEYNVTFTWGKLNKLSMTFDGDAFNGKYSKPEKSAFTVTVGSGEPTDMGTIELSTGK